MTDEPDPEPETPLGERLALGAKSSREQARMTAQLLAAAPNSLKQRGYRPLPKPRKLRRIRVPIWVGRDASGHFAIALPSASSGPERLAFYILQCATRQLAFGGRQLRPSLVIVLLPHAEPIRIGKTLIGQTRVESVYVPDVPSRVLESKHRSIVRMAITYRPLAERPMGSRRRIR